MYVSDFNCLMGLGSGLATVFFNNMIKTRNFVIIETKTLSNFCPLMNLFTHWGFDKEDIRTYGMNSAICKDSQDTLVTVTTGSAEKYIWRFYEILKITQQEHMWYM